MSYTWSNNREEEAWARLDRFLLSPTILLWFPNLFQPGMPRSLSDHNPVLIGVSPVSGGPFPFRFLNWWLEEKDMTDDAIKGWTNCVMSGTKGCVLFSKAKAVKMRSNNWVLASKGSMIQPSAVEKKLEVIDRMAAVEGWTVLLKGERSKLLEELWKSYRREEQTWRQKSLINWLVEGDKNTKKFHSVANGRKRRNFISDISFQGIKILDPTILRSNIFSFFELTFRRSIGKDLKCMSSTLKSFMRLRASV
ncbi:hypothetical protein Dsin_023094 [Dipteronia sinensis]|uniref:Reverse transcriptase n=1 Tax=Dipteronia sinensis TaxID=43782 RepID=A0AAE0A3U2_9ROSI|nr:hypothetical protein Dsin_023094 [Dipteronia sinensis]